MQSSDTTCNSRVKTEIVASSNRNLLSATRQSSCHQQKIQLSHFIFLSQGHTYFRLILNKLQIIFYLGKITGGLLKEIKLSFMMDQNVWNNHFPPLYTSGLKPYKIMEKELAWPGLSALQSLKPSEFSYHFLKLKCLRERNQEYYEMKVKTLQLI